MQREARPRRSPLAFDALPRSDVLSSVGLVDHHAHGILAESPSLDEFRGLFSESTDPRQWPHIATGVTYRRAMRELAALFGVEPSEDAVYDFRRSREFDDYATALCARRTPSGCSSTTASRRRARASTGSGSASSPDAARPGAPHRDARGEPDVAGAREAGFVALKTIAAYRGGLDRVSGDVVAALETNEATGDPLPVQVHCGFGDADLHLWRADPSYLKPLIERFRDDAVRAAALLPVRARGRLARARVRQRLVRPLADDPARRPGGRARARGARARAGVEAALRLRRGAGARALLPAAKWWREALAEVLAEALPPDEAESAGRAILRDNALALYRLSSRGG